MPICLAIVELHPVVGLRATIRPDVHSVAFPLKSADALSTATISVEARMPMFGRSAFCAFPMQSQFFVTCVMKFG